MKVPEGLSARIFPMSLFKFFFHSSSDCNGDQFKQMDSMQNCAIRYDRIGSGNRFVFRWMILRQGEYFLPLRGQDIDHPYLFNQDKNTKQGLGSLKLRIHTFRKVGHFCGNTNKQLFISIRSNFIQFSKNLVLIQTFSKVIFEAICDQNSNLCIEQPFFV